MDVVTVLAAAAAWSLAGGLAVSFAAAARRAERMRPLVAPPEQQPADRGHAAADHEAGDRGPRKRSPAVPA
jgi:hypothetical protein